MIMREKFVERLGTLELTSINLPMAPNASGAGCPQHRNDMPNFLRVNYGWLVVIITTLLSLGFGYRGLTAQNEKLAAIQLLQGLGFGYRGIKAEIEKVSTVQLAIVGIKGYCIISGLVRPWIFK